MQPFNASLIVATASANVQMNLPSAAGYRVDKVTKKTNCDKTCQETASLRGWPDNLLLGVLALLAGNNPESGDAGFLLGLMAAALLGNLAPAAIAARVGVGTGRKSIVLLDNALVCKLLAAGKLVLEAAGVVGWVVLINDIANGRILRIHVDKDGGKGISCDTLS